MARNNTFTASIINIIFIITTKLIIIIIIIISSSSSSSNSSSSGTRFYITIRSTTFVISGNIIFSVFVFSWFSFLLV